MHCVPLLGQQQRHSPSTHGARSSGTDRGHLPAPCTYNRGSRLASPCQKCPHLAYCSTVDILTFLKTSSLDLCFVSEVEWDTGDVPGGSRCVLGEVIQQTQARLGPWRDGHFWGLGPEWQPRQWRHHRTAWRHPCSFYVILWLISLLSHYILCIIKSYYRKTFIVQHL